MGQCQPGTWCPARQPVPRTPHLLLWIHTKITIAYPSRIFKSTIFTRPSRFSCLLLKRERPCWRKRYKFNRVAALFFPGAPGGGKALPPSSGGTTLADCRVTFPPAGGGFLCGFPRSTRPASGTAPARQRPGTAGFSPHQSASRPDRCQRPAPPPTGASATRDRPQQKGQAVPQHIVPHQGMHMDDIHPQGRWGEHGDPLSQCLASKLRPRKKKKHSRATALITMKGRRRTQNWCPRRVPQHTVGTPFDHHLAQPGQEGGDAEHHHCLFSGELLRNLILSQISPTRYSMISHTML